MSASARSRESHRSVGAIPMTSGGRTMPNSAPAPNAKLRATGLGMVFERDGGTISVLDDISLSVAEGEFVCLLGPSGCGKSTILNVMAGFIAPTAGEVRIDGEP